MACNVKIRHESLESGRPPIGPGGAQMIRPGICSVTLARHSPREILGIAAAGLRGIEWWGRGHVPHGDIVAARAIGDRTRAAGLEVSSYGSYYRAGVSEAEGLSFVSVLDTAAALEAPLIRVWAGNQNGIEAAPGHVRAVIDDTLRIADLSAARNMAVTFEYHGGTLTDCNETAARFSARVSHPNVWFSWQPPQGCSLEYGLEGLRALLPRLGTLHVYHWTVGSCQTNTGDKTVRPLKASHVLHRHPLADGRQRWEAFLGAARTTGRGHWALLEFVRDDSPRQMAEDAAVLNELCRTGTPAPHSTDARPGG